MNFGNNAVIEVTGLTRPADTSESQESWTTGVKITGLSCYLEQVDPKIASIFSGENAFKTFQILTNEILDIKETDKVTDDKGRTFTVQGVQTFKGDQDVPDHMEIMIVKKY